jgi:hypothetical protein
MANRVYLVGSDLPGTAGPNEVGINYDPNVDILAGSSYWIPVLWLALYTKNDIAYHVVEDEQIPSLVKDVEAARTQFESRERLLRRSFPENDEQIDAWQELIDELPFAYVKIDAVELWMMGSGTWFEDQLRAAMRWFDTRDRDSFHALLSLAGAFVDPEQSAGDVRRLPFEHLHGYRWVRLVPWDDDADDTPPLVPYRPPREQTDFERAEELFARRLSAARHWAEKHGRPPRTRWLFWLFLMALMLIGAVVGVMVEKSKPRRDPPPKAKVDDPEKDLINQLKTSEGGEAFRRLLGVPSPKQGPAQGGQ